MTRVWLARWEWACCGDPFEVGDDIDFGILARAPQLALADELDPEVVATVDAVESHHEEEFADRVRGRVVAIQAVARDVIERRSLRRPGHGAPLDAVMPSDGSEWPAVRRDLGGGVFAGSQPSRFVVEMVPVPGSVVLIPAQAVRSPAATREDPVQVVAKDDGDPPAERRSRSLVGWLVDVEEP